MLEGFVKDNFDKLFTSWHVVLVDNLSSKDVSDKLKQICKDSRFSYVLQGVPKSLKLNFSIGLKHGLKILPDADIIGVFESDLQPNIETLNAMKHTILSEQNNGCCSVSPMYKWRERYCYPTHKHWYEDPIYKKTKYGTVTKTHAVPFLCSFWIPNHFAKINNKIFREFLHLDSDFGKFLTNEGYLHLRLKDMHVTHTGGGRQSRRGLSNTKKRHTPIENNQEVKTIVKSRKSKGGTNRIVPRRTVRRLKK